jgi:alpha-L-rhamnosidase
MGIEPLEPGFARMRIRPQIASLKEAQITTPTIRGPVKLHVSQPNERTWRASVTIPANTTAEIHVPAADPVQVFEGGRAATGAPHVKFLRMDEGRTVFEIRGGSYEFEMRGNKPTADK